LLKLKIQRDHCTTIIEAILPGIHARIMAYLEGCKKLSEQEKRKIIDGVIGCCGELLCSAGDISNLLTHPQGVVAAFKALPGVDKLSLLMTASRGALNFVQVISSGIAFYQLNCCIEIAKQHLIACQDVDTAIKVYLEQNINHANNISESKTSLQEMCIELGEMKVQWVVGTEGLKTSIDNFRKLTLSNKQ